MSVGDVAADLKRNTNSSEVHVTAADVSETFDPVKMPHSLSHESKPSTKADSESSNESMARSEYYRLMCACLQEKFDYVQASTDRLRDRLYHVKKEVTYLKRMKRVLIRRLARYGEAYSYAPLEIPDNVDVEDPSVKRKKERRERERERKEILRAARKANNVCSENIAPSTAPFQQSLCTIGEISCQQQASS